LNDAFLEILEDPFDTNHKLFPASIPGKEMLQKRIQAYRTFRRTSDSIAIKEGISQTDIDVINCWQAMEKAKGSRPSWPLRQHYAELELLLCPVSFRFSISAVVKKVTGPKEEGKKC
jgi:hypothetical protein